MPRSTPGDWSENVLICIQEALLLGDTDEAKKLLKIYNDSTGGKLTLAEIRRELYGRTTLGTVC